MKAYKEHSIVILMHRMYLLIYLGIGATQSMSSDYRKDPVVFQLTVTNISHARVFYICMTTLVSRPHPQEERDW